MPPLHPTSPLRSKLLTYTAVCCRYVMDTYSNDHNRHTNHGLAAFHSFASWGVVLPATTGKHQWRSALQSGLRLAAAMQWLPTLAGRRSHKRS